MFDFDFWGGGRSPQGKQSAARPARIGAAACQTSLLGLPKMPRLRIPAEALRGFEAYLRHSEPERVKPGGLYQNACFDFDSIACHI